MFILQLPDADERKVRQRTERCGRGTEAFLSEDGPGGLVLCHAKACRVGKGTILHRVDLQLSEGKVGRKGGRYLLFVGARVPSDYRVEFAAWYEKDHLPLLMECPTWDGCRIVEEPVKDGVQFYSFHQVSDPAAFESEQRRQARDTPWFHRLKAHDWFDEGFSRGHYRRLGR